MEYLHKHKTKLNRYNYINNLIILSIFVLSILTILYAYYTESSNIKTAILIISNIIIVILFEMSIWIDYKKDTHKFSIEGWKQLLDKINVEKIDESILKRFKENEDYSKKIL